MTSELDGHTFHDKACRISAHLGHLVCLDMDEVLVTDLELLVGDLQLPPLATDTLLASTRALEIFGARLSLSC